MELKKTAAYVFYTCLSSWTVWISLIFLSRYRGYSFGEMRFMLLFSLGGLGPFFTALFLRHREGPGPYFGAFLEQIVRWKVHPIWYVRIFLVPLLLFSIPWMKNVLSSENPVPLFREKVLILFTLIPVNILFGGLEEVGWRGYLLDQLIKKLPAASAAVLTSIIWSLWHAPLWFIRTSPQEGVNFLFFIILGLCFSFLLTSVYTRTGSLLLCILLHSIFNSYPAIINMPFRNIYFESFIMLLFAMLIFILYEYQSKILHKNGNKRKNIIRH